MGFNNQIDKITLFFLNIFISTTYFGVSVYYKCKDYINYIMITLTRSPACDKSFQEYHFCSRIRHRMQDDNERRQDPKFVSQALNSVLPLVIKHYRNKCLLS